MAEGIPARLSRAEARRFGLTVGGAFLVLGALLWWRGRLMGAEVAAAAGALLVVAGLVRPGLLRPVHRVWMAAALAMSKVTTPIFLSIVYFGVLTPIGLVRRLLGGSPIAVKRQGRTTWVDRSEQGRSPADMEHQF
jgi:Saxitoxin biosynthesis operon protein SxtJ